MMCEKRRDDGGGTTGTFGRQVSKIVVSMLLTLYYYHPDSRHSSGNSRYCCIVLHANIIRERRTDLQKILHPSPVVVVKGLWCYYLDPSSRPPATNLNNGQASFNVFTVFHITANLIGIPAHITPHPPTNNVFLRHPHRLRNSHPLLRHTRHYRIV